MIRKAIVTLCTLGAFVVATTWIVGGGNTGYVLPAGGSSLVVALQGRALGIYTVKKLSASPYLPPTPFRASIFRREEGWIGAYYRIEIEPIGYSPPSPPQFTIILPQRLRVSPMQTGSLRIPLWLLAGLLAAYPLSVLIRRPFRRRRHRLRHNLCLGCGYPLKGLPSPTCPECATPFDPKATRGEWSRSGDKK